MTSKRLPLLWKPMSFPAAVFGEVRSLFLRCLTLNHAISNGWAVQGLSELSAARRSENKEVLMDQKLQLTRSKEP